MTEMFKLAKALFLKGYDWDAVYTKVHFDYMEATCSAIKEAVDKAYQVVTFTLVCILYNGHIDDPEPFNEAREIGRLIYNLLDPPWKNLVGIPNTVVALKDYNLWEKCQALTPEDWAKIGDMLKKRVVAEEGEVINDY